MALLVRIVRSLAAWNEPDRDRAIGNFALRPDEHGLSVWQATTDSERDLVVAAWCLKKTRLEPVSYIRFEEQVALEIGEIAVSPGDSPLTTINALHRELRWLPMQLTALADRLLGLNLAAERMGKPEVRAVVSELDPSDIDEPARTWVTAGFPKP